MKYWVKMYDHVNKVLSVNWENDTRALDEIHE